MHDFRCKDPDKMYYSELAEKTRYFKQETEGLKTMGNVMEQLMIKREREMAKKYELKIAKAEAKANKAAEEKAKAEAKAANDEKVSFVKKMLKNNESIEKIMLYSDLTQNEVRALAAKLSA